VSYLAKSQNAKTVFVQYTENKITLVICRWFWKEARSYVHGHGCGIVYYARIVQNSYQCKRSPLKYMQTRVSWNPYTSTRTRSRVYVNAA